MKWSVNQVAELHKMCMDGVPNADIAFHFGVPVTEIHAKRSQLGITIPKVAAIKGKPAITVNHEFEAAVQEAEQGRSPRCMAANGYMKGKSLSPNAYSEQRKAFCAGWDAAYDYLLKELEKLRNKKAPNKAATSFQRKDNNPTNSIPARR